MADFTTFDLEANTGSNGTPTWTDVLGANREIRFHDTSTVGLTTASASWPYMTRPTSGTLGVDYAYAATADTTLIGVLGSGGAPTAFTNASYMQARWNWDGVGTFASAPIFTAYPSGAHGAVTPGDGSLLGGHATDTSSQSYLKGNAFGRVTSAGAPAAAPGAAPVVTDGTNGSVSPTAGANWLANYQSLQGDSDYITAPFTPAATTTDQWNVMFRLFTGVNMTPATWTPVISLRYTYT